MNERISAGELSKKAFADNTKYKALEVGHYLSEDIGVHLRAAIDNYKDIILEEEFCVVMVIAKDPLIKNLMRRKFYCWPYLPSPRPNQSVFLYNRHKDDIIKRLWVLPSDMVMAELAGNIIVDKVYETMQAWSVAFFEGKFWEFIRHMHSIDMLSEQEYLHAHREELIKSGCKVVDASFSEPFDFSKVQIEKIIDTKNAMVPQDSLCSFG